MPKLTTNLLACSVLCALATGMALRHDVEEKRYLELGASFPAVAQVGGLGSGTLVAPDWVLTAAHVPEMLERMLAGKPLTVKIAGKTYEVDRVERPEERLRERDRHDIALLHLASAVPAEVVPLKLWQEDVAPGTEFVLAGWGVLAQGQAGVKVSPEAMAAPTRELRAGWNKIEAFDVDNARLMARFDGPETGMELEAAPCIGDSGGPALLRVEGAAGSAPTWQVAGVTALTDDVDEDGIIGEYGDEFGMTLVAAYSDWALKTMQE